ncbi:unnamed protein product [Rotaria magnacalcarata]|uniref:Uncharacterized protein n=1 Tax=Rotaria magnacalcarata TaxID=392030 RepID=A0A817AVN6_9BILA|nr:unnamed protein product [Rotaria magnacalcarata]CAF4091584.1 unnamed protein product [Rotaria magnacalcarata]CAF4433553.1 unnamed protein product [Rotaria magnacalcarata]CAF5193621.1 unnamed protein product [Rotaria magnacalcarata]
MLQFDAREHHLVQEFYQLKPRQTEIQKAKFIWKATTDEQAMRYEIALFNTYLSKQTLPESTTSQNILFPQINQLLTQTIFQNQNISTNEITKQALAKAEQLAITYESLAYNQISELEKTRCNHKNPQLLDKIIDQIINRQQTIIQRAQYTMANRKLEE